MSGHSALVAVGPSTFVIAVSFAARSMDRVGELRITVQRFQSRPEAWSPYEPLSSESGLCIVSRGFFVRGSFIRGIRRVKKVLRKLFFPVQSPRPLVVEGFANIATGLVDIQVV